MNVLIPLALMGLFLASTPAFAQAEPTGADRPDDAAWVDECPPDAMCAFGGDPQPYGNETCIECSGPVAYGNDTCVECSGPLDDGPDGGTCMDGAQADEACRDDVLYFGPGGEPHETGAVDEAADAAGKAQSNDAAGAGALLALGALAATMAVLRRK